jgi:hypothetical protein
MASGASGPIQPVLSRSLLARIAALFWTGPAGEDLIR